MAPALLLPAVAIPGDRCKNFLKIIVDRNQPTSEIAMDAVKEVTLVLDQVLSLGARATAFTHDTHLLGAIPELDSMAVVTLITALEEHFGISVDDDDIDGTTFATVGSLADFVSSKLVA